jgi:predicted lipid-binding transport protein (Tim44 family)
MWGSWFGITIGGLLVVLLAVALAFGLSIAVFGALIALLAIVAIAGAYGLKSAAAGRPIDRSIEPDPVQDAAPASTEGAVPPQIDQR